MSALNVKTVAVCKTNHLGATSQLNRRSPAGDWVVKRPLNVFESFKVITSGNADLNMRDNYLKSVLNWRLDLMYNFTLNIINNGRLIKLFVE